MLQHIADKTKFRLEEASLEEEEKTSRDNKLRGKTFLSLSRLIVFLFFSVWKQIKSVIKLKSVLKPMRWWQYGVKNVCSLYVCARRKKLIKSISHVDYVVKKWTVKLLRHKVSGTWVVYFLFEFTCLRFFPKTFIAFSGSLSSRDY